MIIMTYYVLKPGVQIRIRRAFNARTQLICLYESPYFRFFFLSLSCKIRRILLIFFNNYYDFPQSSFCGWLITYRIIWTCTPTRSSSRHRYAFLNRRVFRRVTGYIRPADSTTRAATRRGARVDGALSN